MELVHSFVEKRCPLTGQIEKVYYRRITETPLVDCNGCENCCGSTTCLECRNQIEAELANNP